MLPWTALGLKKQRCTGSSKSHHHTSLTTKFIASLCSSLLAFPSYNSTKQIQPKNKEPTHHLRVAFCPQRPALQQGLAEVHAAGVNVQPCIYIVQCIHHQVKTLQNVSHTQQLAFRQTKLGHQFICMQHTRYHTLPANQRLLSAIEMQHITARQSV